MRPDVAVTAVLADGHLGQLVRFTGWNGPPSLRRILIDIIDEYARHVGPADLNRESVDGLTGGRGGPLASIPGESRISYAAANARPSRRTAGFCKLRL